MGQSEIGIDVDLDPDTPWWQTLLTILAVIAVAVAVVALVVSFTSVTLAVIWGAIKTAGTFLAASGLTSVIAVGGTVVAASSLMASRIFKSYVFTIIFIFARGNI